MILARPGWLFVVKVLDKIGIIEGTERTTFGFY
jgi:hypothetical protein